MTTTLTRAEQIRLSGLETARREVDRYRRRGHTITGPIPQEKPDGFVLLCMTCAAQLWILFDGYDKTTLSGPMRDLDENCRSERRWPDLMASDRHWGLARSCRTQPRFLGHLLAIYARSEGLGDSDRLTAQLPLDPLRQAVGLAVSPLGALHRLELYPAPSRDDAEAQRRAVVRMARETTIDEARLREVLDRAYLAQDVATGAAAARARVDALAQATQAVAQAEQDLAAARDHVAQLQADALQ